MKVIDLRSDTVTVPSEAMRQAMFEASVGDDVYGEDPTVNRLEAMAADLTGKEAALFTTSGTQSNLISVLSHTGRGDEVILGKNSHIFINEVGGASAIGGVVMNTIPNDEAGRLDPEMVRDAIRGENIHYPRTKLLCLENTHNKCGGTILSPSYTSEICDLVHEKGLRVHLDGARIFNASVALKIPVTELTGPVDSVSFCLSKGLGAPVGSMLCGNRDFIVRARKIRKMLGGGMRQAGIIAAAGIVALETMIDRLADDHATAHKLSAGIAGIPGMTSDPERHPTNIVMFSLDRDLSAEKFVQGVNEIGVKIGRLGGNEFRAVTHYLISDQDIDEALNCFATVVGKIG